MISYYESEKRLISTKNKTQGDRAISWFKGRLQSKADLVTRDKPWWGVLSPAPTDKK